MINKTVNALHEWASRTRYHNGNPVRALKDLTEEDQEKVREATSLLLDTES